MAENKNLTQIPNYETACMSIPRKLSERMLKKLDEWRQKNQDEQYAQDEVMQWWRQYD